MHVYKVHAPEDDDVPARWEGTRAEAHCAAREMRKVTDYTIVVELMDLQTDKAGILCLLHGTIVGPTLMCGRLTARGGLQFVNAEGEKT